jgi:hypothetical protein
MTDKETFFVVIGVDKPTGDRISIARPNFSRLGMEYIYTIDSDL